VRALVTGASGFLGRHVVAALLKRGHEVRAMVRSRRSAQGLGLGWPEAVEVFQGDLLTSGDLESAFAGADVLVHLAASMSGDKDAQIASGVTGSERLLAAMARSSTRRLVLCSSFSVYDWSAIEGTLDEDSPLEPIEPIEELEERGAYAVAKALQERAVRRLAREHGFALTVLRPGFIWGRGHGYFAGMGQKIGPLHLVFGPLARVPLTHVENCADLFAVAAQDPRAAGHTFNVVDGPGPRIWEQLGEHLRRSGERGLRVPVPYRLGMLAARAATAAGRLALGKKAELPGLMIASRFEARFKPLRFTNERAERVLGWRPPLDYGSCLERTYGSDAQGS
jgi:nucleoside-diphosphate-sugar epimerase